MHHNAPAQILGKQSLKRAGMQVVGCGRQKKITHRLTGMLSSDFVTALQAYGVGFTRQDMMDAPSESGGHPNLRAAVDFLQAQSLECTYQRCL
jgi:hypothetical protein